MISNDQAFAQAPQNGHPGQSSGQFEMRESAIERTKSRLDKYRKTAEKKTIDENAFLEAKLRQDMQETQKYLAKVNDNKSVKSKRDKKSEPGVGTLTKDQTVVVQKKIQEQIKKNEDQFKIQEKKSKTQSTKCFENDLIPGLGSFPSGQSLADFQPLESFPNLPNGLASLSDQDIQSVLGDVKQENSNQNYIPPPSSQHSTSALPPPTHNPNNLTPYNSTYPYATQYQYPPTGYPTTGFNQFTYQPPHNQTNPPTPQPPMSQSNFVNQINSNQFQSGLPSHSAYQTSSTQNSQLQDFLSNQYS